MPANHETSEHQGPKHKGRFHLGGFHFGLKSLLVATAIFAGVMYFVVLTIAWGSESQAILQEYNRVRGADGPTIATRKFRGQTYALANVPCRVTDNQDDDPIERTEVTTEDLQRRNSGEVWVTPPGEWVTQPSRAIHLLVNHL